MCIRDRFQSDTTVSNSESRDDDVVINREVPIVVPVSYTHLDVYKRQVILRAHETVELAVIHRRQPFLELRRLLFEPFSVVSSPPNPPRSLPSPAAGATAICCSPSGQSRR